jgi:hypothetical protein
MLEKITEIKSKLAELAPVLNSFKSEAVQLKLLEIILGEGFIEDPNDQENGEVRSAQKHRRKKKAKTKDAVSDPAATKSPAKRKAVASGSGANATVSQIAQGDFFKQPRTINDILIYCKDQLARVFKANDISGKLGRMFRDGVLTRKKNKDNQYEYKKA